MPLLQIERLEVSYRRIKAVQGVSLTVEPRQISTVIGPNGAGKTSMLSAVIGLCPGRVDLTGWLGTGLIERIGQDRRSRKTLT